MSIVARLGVRGRLLGLTLALIGVAGSVGGLYLEHRLHDFLVDRAETDLGRQAHAFDAALRLDPTKDPQTVATALGRAAEVRLTLIAPGGRVIADSDVHDVASLDNHAARPEVATAAELGQGIARRYSTSLGTDLLYAAARRGAIVKQAAPGDDPANVANQVVRAARPLAEVEALITTMRVVLAISASLALLVALLMGSIASHLSTLALRRTVMRARGLHITDEDVEVRGDELDYLMGSFESMSDELRRTMKSLAKARDRFEVVVEGMDQAVFRLNAKHEVKLANRAAAELLELDVVPSGVVVTDLMPQPALKELLDGEGDDDEFELPNGRRVLAQHSRMRVSRGSVLVLYDVTRLRRLETVRRDFVANVSHELRTPVSVIRANTEALLEPGIDEAQRLQFVRAMNRASERLTRLIADLLDLARIESGHFQPLLSSVRLADIVGPCADAVMPRIEEREHDVELDLEEGLLVEADPSALEQVLINLLDNAAKYTPSHGHLRLRAIRIEQDRVRIEVIDDGPGIAVEHRARLFERFYRVDPGRSKELGGTGLGLAIVKHLVHAMHGDVGMDPQQPHGACFFVELPAGRAEKRAA